jgi:hypothetical protein
MCYILLLSTTSDENLEQYNTELLQFSRNMPISGAAAVEATALRYQHRWYVGSRSDCSCSFRHLYSVELGFGEPAEWYPEEPENIEATLQFMRVVRPLVAKGHAVECVDAWEHSETRPREHKELLVPLASVSDREFRFFENHRFVFGESA